MRSLPIQSRPRHSLLNYTQLRAHIFSFSSRCNIWYNIPDDDNLLARTIWEDHYAEHHINRRKSESKNIMKKNEKWKELLPRFLIIVKRKMCVDGRATGRCNSKNVSYGEAGRVRCKISEWKRGARCVNRCSMLYVRTFFLRFYKMWMFFLDFRYNFAIWSWLWLQYFIKKKIISFLVYESERTRVPCIHTYPMLRTKNDTHTHAHRMHFLCYLYAATTFASHILIAPTIDR